MPRNVFIIDDADFMIDMIRMILEDADYRVVGASTDSVIALSQLRELAVAPKPTAVDIVIVDLHMPKLDGFETVRRLREIFPTAKVLLVTANSSLPVALKARELRIDGFVVKPFEPEVLLEQLARLT